MVMDGRSGVTGQPDTRYKFTGKERDIETGYDYFGARYYDSRIGRWMSVDPKGYKYPSWSNYNYCYNNPLRVVDPNGDTVRIYTETNVQGHAWISTGEGSNLVVYTYGRYGGTYNNSCGISRLSDAPGVLVKLIGKDAADFNAGKQNETDVSVFQVLDISDEQVGTILDKLFNSSAVTPSEGKYAGNKSAHVVDNYSVLDVNCTTRVADVINAAGSEALERFPNPRTGLSSGQHERFILPLSLQQFLEKKSVSGSNIVKKQ